MFSRCKRNSTRLLLRQTNDIPSRLGFLGAFADKPVLQRNPPVRGAACLPFPRVSRSQSASRDGYRAHLSDFVSKHTACSDTAH